MRSAAAPLGAAAFFRPLRPVPRHRLREESSAIWELPPGNAPALGRTRLPFMPEEPRTRYIECMMYSIRSHGISWLQYP